MDGRDYQKACTDATFAAIDEGAKGVLNALATGLGKTVCAGLMARRMDSLLFIVDREELAFQSQRTLQRMTGKQVFLECGADYRAFKTAPGARFVVAMSQSMIRRKEAYSKEHFEYIIEDECQHSVSATRTAIRDYFAGRRATIGFSATPKRADNKAAGIVFDRVAYEMSFLQGVDLGWLVPFKSRVVTCHDMDLRGFKGSGEYKTEDLRKQIEKQAVIEHIARKTVAIADGRQTVIFARTVQQSQQICAFLKSMGIRATHVDGKMHRWVRRDRLNQFGERNFQIVCNCGLIEEGVDVPGIEVVSMAAPMRSQGKFMQRIGRGSRSTIDLTGTTPEERRLQIAQSDKPYFTVIDFIGQMDEHSAAMCFSGDLLSGDFEQDDEVKRAAIRFAAEGDGDDMIGALNKAKEYVAHKRRKLTPQQEREAARERYARAEISKEQIWQTTTVFHPFDVLALDKREPDREVPKSQQYGQVLQASERYLADCKLRPNEIAKLTQAQRVYLAKKLRERAETMAPYPQARTIHAAGYEPANMTKAEANALSIRIQNAGFVRPREDGPNERYMASRTGSPISSTKDFVFT